MTCSTGATCSANKSKRATCQPAFKQVADRRAARLLAAVELDFDALDPPDFEEFCVSLLGELGFVNIDWRRGSPRGGGAPDGARDIEADLVTKDVDDETRLDPWFIDSKHYGKAVPPSALEPTLAWANAERPAVALFLVSGFLSNSAKDYLKRYVENNRPSFRIKYWERPQIEKLAGDKGELLSRFLLRSGFRPEAEVIAAEEEYFEKVWHERKMAMKARIESGDDSVDPKLWERALKAAKEMEEERGPENFGPYSDFEWGMVNGKLSALRWVLGDEWDFLDT